MSSSSRLWEMRCVKQAGPGGAGRDFHAHWHGTDVVASAGRLASAPHASSRRLRAEHSDEISSAGVAGAQSRAFHGVG